MTVATFDLTPEEICEAECLRYEEVLKALDAFQRTARRASFLETTLDTKLKYHRLSRVLETTRQELRKNMYNHRDACELIESRAGEEDDAP